MFMTKVVNRIIVKNRKSYDFKLKSAGSQLTRHKIFSQSFWGRSRVPDPGDLALEPSLQHVSAATTIFLCLPCVHRSSLRCRNHHGCSRKCCFVLCCAPGSHISLSDTCKGNAVYSAVQLVHGTFSPCSQSHTRPL